MTDKAAKLPEIPAIEQPIPGEPPLQLGQEWANALTHGIGVAMTSIAGVYLILLAGGRTKALTIACVIYVLATLGTYLFSTLSHLVRRQPLLNTMRAWDQAMIYTMIAGTYTPLTIRYGSDPTQVILLAVMWAAAAAGFLSKVTVKHRVNSSGTVSYLLLGYIPGMVLASQVPISIGAWMLAGGLVYSLGVVFLINDFKVPYLHAAWHVMVMIASACHFYGMLEVVRT